MNQQTILPIASALLLLAATNHSPANLIAYWPFEEGEGTTISDVIGGFDGTAEGGSWVAGKVGSFAYQGSGGNSINCGAAPSPATQDLTLAWWMIDNHERWGTIMDKSVEGSRLGYNILVRPANEDSPLRFRIGGWQLTDGPWPSECRVPVGAYNDGEWVHVACTYDSATDTASIYINGALPENGDFNPKTGIAGEGGYCDGVNHLDTPLFIRGGEEGFNGVLDEVAIWDRALTADEVMSVFTSGPLSVEIEQSFDITAVDYNPDDNEITLSWDSQENESYAVRWSRDMVEWDGDLNDDVPAAAGETTTTMTFDLSDAGLEGAQRVYFRVEKLGQ